MIIIYVTIKYAIHAANKIRSRDKTLLLRLKLLPSSCLCCDFLRWGSSHSRSAPVHLLRRRCTRHCWFSHLNKHQSSQWQESNSSWSLQSPSTRETPRPNTATPERDTHLMFDVRLNLTYILTHKNSQSCLRSSFRGSAQRIQWDLLLKYSSDQWMEERTLYLYFLRPA